MFNWQFKNFKLILSKTFFCLLISLNNLSKDSAYSGYFYLSHVNLVSSIIALQSTFLHPYKCSSLSFFTYKQ